MNSLIASSISREAGGSVRPGKLRPAALITLLAVLLVACRSHALGLACQESGYCSAGLLKPWRGDIYASDDLRSCLEARSYKKETIIITTSASRILPMIQVIRNLQGLGIEHVMVMSGSERECELVAHYLPEYGCAYDKFQIPMPTNPSEKHMVYPAAPIWHTRWRTFARSIRMGYNVMMSDNDVIFFDDPYKYFKSPPFKDIVVLNQAEAIWNEMHYPICDIPNGGWAYVQNAHPDGPAAWMIMEITARVLRYIDDEYRSVMAAHAPKYTAYLDQDCFRDVLWGSRTGVLAFPEVLQGSTDRKWQEENRPTWDRRQKLFEELAKDTMHNDLVDLPPWMHPVAGYEAVLLRRTALKLPHVGPNGWNETLGGNLYGTPGPLTKELRDLLKTDCPTCAGWPDLEDPETYDEVSHTPTEEFAFAPPFMVFGYWPRGRFGFWQKEITGSVVQQVIGHLHFNPAGEMGLTTKIAAQLAVKKFNWQVAHEIHGADAFRLNLNEHGHVHHDEAQRHNFSNAGRVPLLLALHPSVRLDNLKGIKEYQELLIGLSQVAHAMGRGAVFPDMPCSGGWKVETRGQPTPNAPIPMRGEWIPWVKSGMQCRLVNSAGQKEKAKLEDLSCFWAFLAYEQCFSKGKGMMDTEFEHLLEHYEGQLPLIPSEVNTIFMPEEGSYNPAVSLAEQFIVLTEREVKEAAKHYDHWRVVYLGAPVQLEDSYNMNNPCPAMERGHVRGRYQGEDLIQVHNIKRFKGEVGEGGKVTRTQQEVKAYNEDRPLGNSRRRKALVLDPPSSDTIPFDIDPSLISKELLAHRGHVSSFVRGMNEWEG